MRKTAGEEERIQLRRLFGVSGARLRTMIGAFHGEMRRGLAGEPGSLQMLPAYVDIPTGLERGTFLALDLGGTNVRVLWVELPGDGSSPTIVEDQFQLSREQIASEGKVLFGAITRFIGRFLGERNLSGRLPLGFTFSFAIRQRSIARGELIAWTKGWTAEGVVGRDVVELLNAALGEEGVPGVRVVSLNNDTTGTLMALAFLDADCDAGCILGTGTNICYRERTAEIRSPTGPYDREFMVVNMESGNFNASLPRNRYDVLLDGASENPGSQAEEKMVSGKYLGELARLVVADLCGRGLMFGGRLPEIFAACGKFGSEHLSEIEADESSAADEARAWLEDWGIRPADGDDARFLRDIARLISGRAARIAAAALAATVTKNDPALDRPHVIAVDGSVFHKYPRFRARMEETFRELYRDRADRLWLASMQDGSGFGAAIIAAATIGSSGGADSGFREKPDF
jgi:hexokinase